MLLSSHRILKWAFILPVILTSVLKQAGFAQQQQGNLRFVNQFIGTTKSAVPTKWGDDGGTYPGAVAPSGAIQLSPETRVTGNKGYDHSDSVIYYFSCYGHMSGFPGGSSGRVYVMPVNAGAKFEGGKYHRRFSHGDETAIPGYYKVVFNDDHTIAEATATTRAGMFRFTYPAHTIRRIFIGDAGEIKAVSNTILHASDGRMVINFSEGYTVKEQVEGGWLFSFDAGETNSSPVTIKISSSSIDSAGAQNNIDRELGHLTFDQIRKKTNEGWQKKLSVIDITDSNVKNKTIFYTALYHSLLIPWVVDDADGRYRGADGGVHQRSGANQYGGFSPWDTFRSLNPLLTLLYPGKEKDVLLSMLDIYTQSGYLPTESMTGNHSIPIIVDAYLKGITGIDKELAYKAMKKSIVDGPFIQTDMEDYQKNGYVPFTRSESVTRTVEYAYDDWALSQFAGKVIHDTASQKLLLNRSYNYRHLLNTDALLMLPRNNDEFKLQPGMSGYKEGDKWVYSYFVPHNTKDLVNLTGGAAQFASQLDSALSNSVILFDNETVFHLPYLFNQAGKPYLTQKWCRKIMLERFSATPGGLPGNDDLGSTSSWYVFSAMGIFPVCPGRPLYTIGSPLFRSVTLHLANGKRLVIKSNNSSTKNNYVRSLNVNGHNWPQLTIPHSLLVKGGTITFNMDSRPGVWAVNNDPVELSETKAGTDIKILNYSVTKKSVEPDQPFAIVFSVTNKGAIGTKAIKLLVNGRPYASKNCLVGAGQIVKDSIVLRLYPEGKNVLQLEGMQPVNFNVKPPQTSRRNLYKITGLATKPLVKLDEQQEITYNIKNIDGITHNFKVPVFINDSVTFNDNVTLAAGAERNVKHTFKAKSKGFKHVKIMDASNAYKVYQESIESVLLDLPAVNYSGDGIIKDMSGFNNNAHINYAVIGNHSNNGEKMLFGDTCFAEINNSNSLDKLGQTITMMAWVYPTGKEGGLVDLFTKGDNHVLQLSDHRTLTFFAGGWGRGDCTVDLPQNWYRNWHHIAGVCSGKTLKVYIDGELKGTTLLEMAVNLSVNNKWDLGRNEEFPSERIFHGYMNKVKIFKEPLSGNEIRAIVNAEK